MKYLLIFALLAASGWAQVSQVPSVNYVELRYGNGVTASSALPANCTDPQVAFKTSAPIGWSYCVAGLWQSALSAARIVGLFNSGTCSGYLKSDGSCDTPVSGGGGAWGTITGSLSAQTDLQAALDAKAPTASLATVATSGSYADLTNKPTIPAAQVNSDWNAGSGLAQILNKPTIPAAQVQTDWNAISGLGVLLNKPTIPAAQVNSDWNSGSGLSQILNKPTLGALAAKSAVDYSTTDVTNKPTLGTASSHAATDFALSATTVNSHPLSSNVVVSASDLTTGTLPHAQLPALLSGDIPANGANTSGTAGGLSANIAESQVTNLVTDLSGKAASNATATINGTVCTLGSTCSITAVTGQQAFKTSDTAGSASNTLVTTGMTFAIAANTTYTLDCRILFSVSTTSGVGLTLGVNGPGTPTQVSLMRQINTTATAFRIDPSQGATWAAKIGATATTVTGLSMALLYGTIENGTTAGTLDIQYANISTTGTTVIKRGSWCKLQ